MMDNKYHLISLVFFLCYQYVGSMILNQYQVCATCTISKIYYSDTRQIILTQEGLLYSATINGTNVTKIDGLSEVVKLHQYEGNRNSFVARKVGAAIFTHDSFASYTQNLLPVYSIGYGLIHVAPFSPGVAFFETYLQIYTTADSGKTWNGPYSGSQFEWSLDPDSANNLFITSLPTRVSESTVFAYTSSFGKNITALFSNVTQTQTFVLTPSYIWVFNRNSSAMVSSVLSDRAHISVASYKPALIPSTPDFFRLDDDSGEYVAVRDIILPVTTIYYTADHGATWNVSIERAALSPDAASVSFNRVAEGVYLVNVVAEGNGDETKVTKISYDYGVTWGDLTMTETDNTTDPECYPKCVLFLRAKTADKKSFYTNPHANGVIVSVGTVGTSTSTNLRTFMSTNSAKSWTELVHEETIYEVGGNGTIIVWAPVTPTTVIWYSNDTGVTRQNWTISSSPVTVYNITTDGKGTNFAVYTRTASASNLVFALNIVNPIIPPDYTIGKGAAKAIRIIFLLAFIFVVLYFVITKTPRIKNGIRRIAGLPPKNYESSEMMLPSH